MREGTREWKRPDAGRGGGEVDVPDKGKRRRESKAAVVQWRGHKDSEGGVGESGGGRELPTRAHGVAGGMRRFYVRGAPRGVCAAEKAREGGEQVRGGREGPLEWWWRGRCGRACRKQTSRTMAGRSFFSTGYSSAAGERHGKELAISHCTCATCLADSLLFFFSLSCCLSKPRKATCTSTGVALTSLCVAARSR